MKKFNMKALPLPILPGDRVYFIVEEDSVESEKAASVGIDEEGHILVVCENCEYVIGPEDCAFLSEEDAERFIEDESSLPEGYGMIPDYQSLDLPYYPGTTFYYCEPNWSEGRWEIFEEYYTYVFFDANGSVRVGDGDSECTVAGRTVDPCFDSIEKARAYVRDHPM